MAEEQEAEMAAAAAVAEGWGWEEVVSHLEQPHTSPPSTPGYTNTPACSHSAQTSRPGCTPALLQPPTAACRCSAKPEVHLLWEAGWAAEAGSVLAGWALAAGSPWAWAQSTRRWRSWQPRGAGCDEAYIPSCTKV